MDDITERSTIFDAWSDEPWVVDGAAVRVSLVCFAQRDAGLSLSLNGTETAIINSDLTAENTSLTQAARLTTNMGIAFMGDTKSGPFDVSGDLARKWLSLPANPNGRPNADVLKPWTNGMDIARRPTGKWIVDFGWEMSQAEAALYESPFAHAAEDVRPTR